MQMKVLELPCDRCVFIMGLKELSLLVSVARCWRYFSRYKPRNSLSRVMYFESTLDFSLLQDWLVNYFPENSEILQNILSVLWNGVEKIF